MKRKHHVIPSSKDGSNHKSNISMVEEQTHQDFHRLFNNMLPQEIIVFLVETFWKGRYSYLTDVLKGREENE